MHSSILFLEKIVTSKSIIYLDKQLWFGMEKVILFK